MRIILLERVGKLGSIGDVVNVKDGYARNFLLPKLKALRATDANMKLFEAKKDEINAKNEKLKHDANVVADKMSDKSIVIIRQASESGFLFGSVTARDIVNELELQGITGIKRQNVVIEQPIKVVGHHIVKVYVHPEVVVDLPIRVMIAQEVGDHGIDSDEMMGEQTEFLDISENAQN